MCTPNMVTGEAICSCHLGYSLDTNEATCTANMCAPWFTQGSDVCTGVTGSVCVPSAQPGYKCTGVKTCEQTGVYSGYASCSKLECPAQQKEGWKESCSGEFGDKCKVSCSAGYLRVGGSDLVCGESGEWEGDAGCLLKSRKSCDDVLGWYVAVCNDTTGDSCSSCGDAAGELTGCIGKESEGVNYKTAHDACQSKHARLCTVAEIEFGALKMTVGEGETGDDFEVVRSNTQEALGQCTTEPLWTGDACGERGDMAWVVRADPDLQVVEHECRERSDAGFALCCADMTARDEVDECLAGLDQCDRVHGFCDHVWGEGWSCGCNEGYQLQDDGVSCTKICPEGTTLDEATGECSCCAPGFVEVTHTSVTGTQSTPVQVGKLEWTLSGADESCMSVKFPTRYLGSAPVYVQISDSASDYATTPSTYSDRSPHFTWVERVDQSGFVACYRHTPSALATGYGLRNASETEPVAVTLNWMAYRSVAGAVVGQVRFPVAGLEWGQMSQCMRVPMPATNLLALHDLKAVQVTGNHRGSATASHGPSAVWVEKFTPEQLEVCAEEARDLAMVNQRHLTDLVVDYAAFVEPDSSDRWLVGSESLSAAKCDSESARDAAQLEADRLGLPSPCRCLRFAPGQGCVSWSQGFDWVPSGSYCKVVHFKQDETALAAHPLVFVSVDHYASELPSTTAGGVAAHEGAVSWVEWVTRKAFRVCFKDLGDHNVKAFEHRSLSYVAVLA